MIERAGILVIYVLLMLVNAWGFRKIKGGAGKHEGNWHLRFLIKRIGLIPTQVFSFFILFLLMVVLPLDSFGEGFIFGLFFFNLIHDYYTIVNIVEREKHDQKKIRDN